MFQQDYLWPPPQQLVLGDPFATPPGIAPAAPWPVAAFAEEPVGEAVHPQGLPLQWELDAATGPAGGYDLRIGPDQVRLVAADRAGLIHGLHTLGQVIRRFRRLPHWQALHITDHPDLTVRGVMLDLGRSIFPLPMLERFVRMMSRLKLNQLHLHLYDDELCGLRFEGLPFGSENPHALSMAEFRALVAYAQTWGIEIVPELEGWGHVGALVYHRPDLRGGPGVYDGASFLIGKPTLALMRELIEQVAAALPEKATIHLGLDEATWCPGPDLPAGYTPSDLIADYHALLQSVGQQLKKHLQLRVWADHGGRPVPEHLVESVIVEPWQYWAKHRENIEAKIAEYGSQPNQRWMMGAGTSRGQYRGSVLATRHWCQAARGATNVEGVNITLWGSNDLESRLISVFGGAAFAWNAFPGLDFLQEDDLEMFDRSVYPRLYAWRGLYPDLQPEALAADRGPLVHDGFYLFGPRHGQPVAPTAPLAGTQGGHDYAAEVEHAQAAAVAAPA